MFKKGPDIDKKKLLLKASDVKKDSLTRLKHFKTLIEHLDHNELPSLFRSHFSFIYHTFIDTFSTFDCNSKQRREDLDCILFMLEKILVYNPELIKKRWQFYSITFVMQKLLHQNNTWRLRQEGVRLFILWYQILNDETNSELQTMYASIVPGILNQHANSSPSTAARSATSMYKHSTSSNSASPQFPIKLCSIDPLVPMLPNEQQPSDETSFYLDNLLQFMVTQTTKPCWSAPDDVRKNQELSFAFTFNMLKKIYLQNIFPDFDCNLLSDPTTRSNIAEHSIKHYVDDMAEVSQHGLRTNEDQIFHTKYNDSKLESRQPGYLSPTYSAPIQTNADHERSIALSVYQSIVIRWLTRIMRQDMMPGQDELIKTGGGSGSTERRDFQGVFKESSSGQEQEISSVSDGNSSNIFQNMDITSREMEIARNVAGTWPENIVVLHELFRRAFLNYFQPASMKRVVNVYKEWICNGGPSQVSAQRSSRLGYSSFGDLLQVFVLNSSNAFLTRVHNPAMLDEQVEMCKRIMNIYRYMVMKIYMNSSTWEQLLNVMLLITEHLFPAIPPEKKENTIGGRIAPAFFQTFIVSWIRANLYVHISDKMWNQFHQVMMSLIRWRELIEEWSTTMGSLTRVLVKHVYGLSLIDLPLDKPQERRRRTRAVKSLSTAETLVSKTNSAISPDPNAVTRGVTSSDSSKQCGSNVKSVETSKDGQFCKGLVRSNSDGILIKNNAKIYFSSSRTESYTNSNEMRKIKSEYLIFESNLGTVANRSNSPLHTDAIDGTSLKDPNMLENDHEIESQLQNKPSEFKNKKLDQKSNQDKCVLLGGGIRGWTPENSVIMWRRMLGLFGNINQIENPDNHLIAMKCLAAILNDFIKTRENLGISIDNQSTPERPNLIPPYTYHAGWLLEATHLPKQFKDSRLLAYKLLCLMSIRRHDIEPPQQHFSAFYEALHRGLNSSDPHIHASIIKNATQLLSLELPGCSFLVNDLLERSKSILLYTPSELSSSAAPRNQATQILNCILALHRPIKKLMVLKHDVDISMNMVAQGEIKSKVFETFLACNSRPIVLDSQTRSRSLCSMTIHVFQEICDKYDSYDMEKLFDTLLTELQDVSNTNLFRINCDLLRLFAEHATFLAQSRPVLVSSVIQTICQLIVRNSTNEANREAIHCLLICLEDWCIAVGRKYLLRSVDSLNAEDDDTLSAGMNDSLITIALRSLENVINDEQFIDDFSNKGTRGSINTSKGSDTHSSSHNSQLGSSSVDNGPRDRTITNDVQRQVKDDQIIENKDLKSIKLACKVFHQRLMTYLGHFPLKQVGAASMSCCVDEFDYIESVADHGDLKNVDNLFLLVINGNTIISLIGSQVNNSKLTMPVHLILRNLCGKYSWDASCVSLDPNHQVKSEGYRDDQIMLDPDSFQQEDSRSSMRYDSDFNEDGNSSSSMSSRASSNRDYIGDLLHQLNCLVTDGSLTMSNQNNIYKKRNTVQSISNSRFKVTQAEETMIALLTNQRFQELNYRERSDDLDRVVLNLDHKKLLLPPSSDEDQHAEQCNKIFSFDQCRQFVQQLGYLTWDKRCKIDSLSKSARLVRELKNLDSQPSRETHKIAVIYVANGQEDKNSILTNTSGSKAFEDFVSGLGWEVNLASHLGFKGGLLSNKSTGETSPYYCNSTTEVMFHVSTRIPISKPADDESLNKKLRHLGNDEIHIVWSEHSRDYRRGIIPTEFSDVIIAIYPMSTFHGYYRIQISNKDDVPLFGPLFDNCIIHQTSLASLVRSTAINASRAKRLKLPHYQSHFEERDRLIETIVQNHRDKLSFEDFAVQLYQTSVIKSQQDGITQDTSCCA